MRAEPARREPSEGNACPECGASRRLGDCRDVFHALLALDHQRLQPWGRFHGLNVACYFLQHPTDVSSSVLGGQWHVVTTYLAGGIQAANDLEATWVRSNRRGTPHAAALPAAPARIAPPTWTIEDVAVDGTFPRQGYEQRMHEWSHSIASERGADA